MNILLQFITGLCISLQAFAAMEFPPTLHSQAEISAYADFIRHEIPELITSKSYALEPPTKAYGPGQGIETYIINEQSMIRELRGNSQYMDLAKARPPLQNLIVRKIRKVTTTGYGANEEWQRLMKGTTAPHESLLLRIESIAPRSSTMIFSGLSRLLPKDQRANLGEADLSRRWRSLLPQLATYSERRMHTDFDISRFSALNINWTLQDLENLIFEVDRQELAIALALQRTLAQSHNWHLPWFANSENIDELLNSDELSPLKPAARNFIATLGRRMAKLYMSETAMIESEEVERELLLRELPPNLAIFRGCIGHDCSTTSSWSMPYSPMERDWWIEDPATGRRYGYASGNLTTLDGQPCLYIRDMAGPGLTPDDLTTILTGFYLAKERFGARVLTLARADFATENHIAELRVQLQSYPGRPVVQTFHDVWIRNTYLGRWSNMTYDGTDAHSNARLLEFSPDHLKTYRAIGFGKTETHEASAWDQLALSVSTGNIGFLPANMPSTFDGPTLLRILHNEAGLSVDSYYRAVGQALDNAGLHMSRNLQRKYESIFLRGFLRAPDAFVGDENIKQAVRYVQEMLWRSTTPDSALPYVQEHVEIFESSESMTRLVMGLFERVQPVDQQRLRILWRAGYRLRNLELNGAKVNWLLSTLNDPEDTLEAFTRVTKHQWGDVTSFHFLQNLDLLAPLLQNELPDETIAERTAELLWDFTYPLTHAPLLTEVKLSLAQDENVKILVPLAAVYLREFQDTSSLGVVAYRALTEFVADPAISQEWKIRAATVVATLPLEIREELRRKLITFKQNSSQDGDCETSLLPPRR